jgi:hypothetical protein
MEALSRESPEAAFADVLTAFRDRHRAVCPKITNLQPSLYVLREKH